MPGFVACFLQAGSFPCAVPGYARHQDGASLWRKIEIWRGILSSCCQVLRKKQPLSGINGKEKKRVICNLGYRRSVLEEDRNGYGLLCIKKQSHYSDKQ